MTTVRSEDRADGVRWLIMDRPPANAIDVTLMRDLQVAVEAAAFDDAVRAVVLTGAGRFFSAGLDLTTAVAERQRASEGPPRFSLLRDAWLALLQLPRPTIAAMSGHAIAGGMIIALSCDFRIAADAPIKFGVNEVAIGASYPRVAREIVRLRLTHANAVEALLGAELYDPTGALRLGFVDELAPPDKLEAVAQAKAAKLGRYPRQAYAHTKAAMVGPAVERTMTETPEEARANAAIWGTPESRAAMTAQLRRLKS